jgi:hypothetical protein
MAQHFYDSGMTERFRHPLFIRSLLTEIIAEPWVETPGPVPRICDFIIRFLQYRQSSFDVSTIRF